MTHRRGLQSLGNKVTSLTLSFSLSVVSVKVLMSSFKYIKIYDKRPSSQAPLKLPSSAESLVDKTPHGRDSQIMRVNCSLPFPCERPTGGKYGCCASVALPFIRPLNRDINQHHYCRFPLLAQLTEQSKGQDAGMKART